MYGLVVPFCGLFVLHGSDNVGGLGVQGLGFELGPAFEELSPRNTIT